MYLCPAASCHSSGLADVFPVTFARLGSSHLELRPLAEVLGCYAREHQQIGPENDYRLTAHGRVLVEELVNQVGSTIKEAARLAAYRIDPGRVQQGVKDFEKDALAYVLLPRRRSRARICSYDPTKGELMPWLRTILRNGLKDRLRHAQRERKRLRFMPLGRLPERRVFDAGVVWSGTERFIATDIARLETWPVRQRLELMCLIGVWQLVPGPRWEHWLSDFEVQTGRSLPRPFPLFQVMGTDDRQGWLGWLATAFGCTTNVLSQHRVRWQHRLAELNYFRERYS